MTTTITIALRLNGNKNRGRRDKRRHKNSRSNAKRHFLLEKVKQTACYVRFNFARRSIGASEFICWYFLMWRRHWLRKLKYRDGARRNKREKLNKIMVNRFDALSHGQWSRNKPFGSLIRSTINFPPFFLSFLFFFSSITSSAWLVDSMISFIFARCKWECISHFLRLRLHFLVKIPWKWHATISVIMTLNWLFGFRQLIAFASYGWNSTRVASLETYTYTQWVINQDVIYNTSVHASAKCQQRPRLITWQQWRRRQSPLLRCKRMN